MSNNKFPITILIILMISACFFSVPYVVAQQDAAAAKIETANNAIIQAYTVVFDAEKSGANVADLLAQLNNAVDLLTQAENFYTAGDATEAANKADSVLPITQEVNSAAQEVRENALVAAQNALWSAVLLVIVGGFVIGFSLFLLWRWFKQRYLIKLSETKPELNIQ